MSKFISKESFASELGVTVHVIEGWIRRHWTKNKEYKVIGKTTFINRELTEEWFNEFNEIAGRAGRKNQRENKSAVSDRW